MQRGQLVTNFDYYEHDVFLMTLTTYFSALTAGNKTTHLYLYLLLWILSNSGGDLESSPDKFILLLWENEPCYPVKTGWLFRDLGITEWKKI